MASAHSPADGPARTSLPSQTRRTLLKGFAAAGAAVSISSKIAWADGEIGFWAKDLPNEKLIDMYSTILRIRWFDRTARPRFACALFFTRYSYDVRGVQFKEACRKRPVSLCMKDLIAAKAVDGKHKLWIASPRV